MPSRRAARACVVFQPPTFSLMALAYAGPDRWHWLPVVRIKTLPNRAIARTRTAPRMIRTIGVAAECRKR
jgi:hypothetical protein